ncbi:cytoplasmic polyadenylation element-binding protein 4-like isoform X2 [Corticium candelabrum]|uniref:cytoplasmic polyadenylation element-binding protein 4-like isoform X2 n=1 Tax=Corticium candelabrum TaxID=121492 RepID=UPI002E258EB7|nr:cytoplasmic polyadenylation element-binding protein 4-like isoform X2 [Corticium candelabrum]
MATGNPETVMNGDALDVFANAPSSSSSSELGDDFSQLKLNDDRGSSGSAVVEKSENPWTRNGEESKECHVQNGADLVSAGNPFTGYNTRQLDISNGFVGVARSVASYRTPWSTESSSGGSSFSSRPLATAQSLMNQTMPWVEAHEAWVNATKRSRATAMATSQYATAALQRRARINSLPVDSSSAMFNFYPKSSRRVASPIDPFDGVYGGDPTSDFLGLGAVPDVTNDVFLPFSASQRASRAAQLYGKGTSASFSADGDCKKFSTLEHQLLNAFTHVPGRYLSDARTDEESFPSSVSSVDDQFLPSPSSPPRAARSRQLPMTECFSRKVFVGGLPPDIDEVEIHGAFCRFGALTVDWPHKAQTKSYFPPKGYAFLLFREEYSVQRLIASCVQEDDKLFYYVSSPTQKEKQVQIRPWCLADSDYVMDRSHPLDPRKTVFVGGVPRPLRSSELAKIMNEKFGNVCYAGIDVDPELKYPKGAGRVAFSSQQSYITAISSRFVQLQLGDIDKRVEIKPYVLDDQMCDECNGMRCGGKFAPFFCGNVTCLQYYCKQCWAVIHSMPGRQNHKPLVKEGNDRPRAHLFRY